MEFSIHISLLASILLIFSLSSSIFCSSALDTITASHFLKETETLSSNNNEFILQFFSPENSSNRYVGIWHMSKSNIVWVANRNEPLRDSSGVVTISADGNLVVLNAQNQVVWSTNVSNMASNSIAQLLDSGNLILLDNTTGNMVWESFQHPCNTLLANMKLSTNVKTGERMQLTSWKSLSDPSIGRFSSRLEPGNVPEVFIWHDNHPQWRSGPWNGHVFLGIPNMYNVYLNGFRLEGESTTYLFYNLADKSILRIYMLNPEGRIEQKYWDYGHKDWKVEWRSPDAECDNYGKCGSFGICNMWRSPICSCLRGFDPRNKEEWKRQNWTSGCVRKKALQCERVKNGSDAEQGDGFLKLQRTKVPDFAEWLETGTRDCRIPCLKNCSCIAYAYDPGIGCIFWSSDLIDLQSFSDGGVDFYIRLPYSELDKDWNAIEIIAITVIMGTSFTIFGYLLWKRIVQCTGRRYVKIQSESTIGHLKQIALQELSLFDFGKIENATNNFDSTNKLGEGGFGPVYKGKLQDGQQIAVKRLSRASSQGVEEFINETVVISKLQHRNLVRLLGCCIEGEEKMLIYEYMPNKSLDAYVFDPSKKNLLDWKKRSNVIEGIARGLLYLHRDSRLRIIHRDLKASNILLDGEMNPKISDFGMARIFGGSENEANTKRVVGTYGYMSPEYAMEGLFSEKSDVFSFGVLLLEIVSGRRNTSFYEDLESLTLLGFAWRLWNDDKIASLIDPEISDPSFYKDIFRCIHIGLLCVQELARDRPNMATVISILNSEIVNLPRPRQPAFVVRQAMLSASTSNQRIEELHSINDVTITNLLGR